MAGLGEVVVVENGARDVAGLDVDEVRIDRAEVVVREACLRRPPLLALGADGSEATLLLECLQLTGSFKVRGALTGIAARLPDARARGVVAVSAGNHGAGVAWAARRLGVSATVVVPSSAPEIKRRRIVDLGAELVVCESASYDDAERAALELARERGARFLSPYDDPDVAAGNGGTLGRDLVGAAGARPRVVVAPVGGGGLVSGLAASLGPRCAVWGVQSAACPAMAWSLRQGAAIEAMRAPGETLAEGLEGGVSASGFARARYALSGVLVVTEEAIAEAMAWARAELGLLLEGSAAVALVPVLARHPVARGATIVLTGRNRD